MMRTVISSALLLDLTSSYSCFNLIIFLLLCEYFTVILVFRMFLVFWFVARLCKVVVFVFLIFIDFEEQKRVL